MNARPVSGPSPLLEVRDLSIQFNGKRVVEGLNFEIYPGEKLALVGESGSGKTVTALGLLGLLDQAQTTGSAVFQAHSDTSSRFETAPSPSAKQMRNDVAGSTVPVQLLGASQNRLRRIRGGDIAMVFQEPMSALNPLMTIGQQIAEVLALRQNLSKRLMQDQLVALLEQTAMPDAAAKCQAYPHQLSGGQRQRAMIAMALASRPSLLIADEPTTALDVSIRTQIMDLLGRLQQEMGMAVLLITHDLNMVRQFADRVIVMEKGRFIEQGRSADVLSAPVQPYTRKLVDSLPVRSVVPLAELGANGSPSSPVVMRGEQLAVSYPRRLPGLKGWFKRGHFDALKNISFTLRQAETLGVMGESGSGKTSLALACLGLIPFEGQLEAYGTTWQHGRSGRQNNLALRKKIQVVFQDPYSSLSPRMTVLESVEEGLRVHEPALNASLRRERVLQELADVGLTEAEFPGLLERYPHQFSGGQRQRLAIARALVVSPRLLILDEPSSALDLTIQQQIILLLQKLQRERQLSYLLISHDIAVVAAMSHRLLVIKDGQFIESGTFEFLSAHAQHPYTRQLLAQLRG